jgi:hypothetical protein
MKEVNQLLRGDHAPVIHLKCNDGASKLEASEFVFHTLPDDTIFIEFFQGKGELGERYSACGLDIESSLKLRLFLHNVKYKF